MIENLDEIALANNLITLSGQSMSEIAREASLSPGNVSNWLRGNKSTLGEEAKSRLFSVLGIAGGGLNSELVHFWTLKKAKLDPFYNVLNLFSKKLELFSVAPNKMGMREILPDRQFLPLILLNEEISIILIRKIYSLELNIPKPDPSKLPNGSHWRSLPDDSFFKFPVQRIPNDVFNQIYENNLSIDEFDHLFRSTQIPDSIIHKNTWEDVLGELQKSGFTPDYVMDLIRSKKWKSPHFKKNKDNNFPDYS